MAEPDPSGQVALIGCRKYVTDAQLYKAADGSYTVRVGFTVNDKTCRGWTVVHLHLHDAAMSEIARAAGLRRVDSLDDLAGREIVIHQTAAVPAEGYEMVFLHPTLDGCHRWCPSLAHDTAPALDARRSGEGCCPFAGKTPTPAPAPSPRPGPSVRDDVSHPEPVDARKYRSGEAHD